MKIMRLQVIIFSFRILLLAKNIVRFLSKTDLMFQSFQKQMISMQNLMFRLVHQKIHRLLLLICLPA